ncbi:MAG: hypothetical protein U0T81_12355 [Saprospiraceae bacterium]
MFRGAIQVARPSNPIKSRNTATSDFMELSGNGEYPSPHPVMAFPYRDLQINILDTPGHKGFC